jgi:hypothetical protein
MKVVVGIKAPKHLSTLRRLGPQCLSRTCPCLSFPVVLSLSLCLCVFVSMCSSRVDEPSGFRVFGFVGALGVLIAEFYLVDRGLRHRLPGFYFNKRHLSLGRRNQTLSLCTDKFPVDPDTLTDRGRGNQRRGLSLRGSIVMKSDYIKGQGFLHPVFFCLLQGGNATQWIVLLRGQIETRRR